MDMETPDPKTGVLNVLNEMTLFLKTRSFVQRAKSVPVAQNEDLSKSRRMSFYLNRLDFSVCIQFAFEPIILAALSVRLFNRGKRSGDRSVAGEVTGLKKTHPGSYSELLPWGRLEVRDGAFAGAGSRKRKVYSYRRSPWATITPVQRCPGQVRKDGWARDAGPPRPSPPTASRDPLRLGAPRPGSRLR